MPQKKDIERKRGNRIGFWFFHFAVRLFGLAGAYGLLYFVAAYYLVFDRAAVKASLAYVRRRFPLHGRLKRLLDVYLLFINQGKSLIDRYYVLAGGPDIQIDIVGMDRLRTLLGGNRGLILLTAHVGNWQVAMTALRKLGKTVHLLMRREDNPAVRASLNIGSEGNAVRILYTDDGLGGVIEAMKAIEKGDLISIMGDRAYDFSAMEAPLLGGTVRFPYGAFTIAAAAQCPVVVLLSAKTGTKRYVVDVSNVIDPPSGRREDKQKQVQECVARFACVLQEYSAEHPYQWFVFRDMWDSNR
jgi:predicted LPLAT superfamily acyltransferase